MVSFYQIIDLKRERELRHVVSVLRVVADIMYDAAILEGVRGRPPVCHVLPVSRLFTNSCSWKVPNEFFVNVAYREVGDK